MVFEKVARKKQISRRQKAKTKMKDEDEKCTKLFHHMARTRNKLNGEPHRWVDYPWGRGEEQGES